MQISLSTDTIYISFPLDDGSFENMHCSRLDEGAYVIDNSPFYAYDISFGDIVSARNDSGRLLFESVVRRGGHSTYRVRLPAGKSHDYFLLHFERLRVLGCSYEGSIADARRLYAIDVAPSSDVVSIYNVLEQVEEDGGWDFEEAHCFKGHGI